MTRTVSLCLIVRDEADNLTACIESARDAVDEVVVVDTGSDDGTVELARSLGAKVSSFEWAESFADARNAALDEATGDFVLVLDADERLESPERVRALVAAEADDAPPTLYLPLIVNLDARGEDLGADRMPRLWRARPELRFTGRIHEEVGRGVPGVRRAFEDGFRIVHYGYDPEVARARGKRERNRALLEAELEEHPDDPRLLFYLAKEEYATGEDAVAAELFLQVVEDGTLVNFALSARVFAVECLRTQGASVEGLALAQAGLAEHPTYGALWYVAGQAALDLDNAEVALEAFTRAKEPATGLAAIAFRDPSVRAWRADAGRARALLLAGEVSAGVEILSSLPAEAASEATALLFAVAEALAQHGDLAGAAHVLSLAKAVVG